MRNSSCQIEFANESDTVRCASQPLLNARTAEPRSAPTAERSAAGNPSATTAMTTMSWLSVKWRSVVLR